MDLYREFRKTIRPIALPREEEKRKIQESASPSMNQKREKDLRKMEDTARSVAPCEI